MARTTSRAVAKSLASRSSWIASPCVHRASRTARSTDRAFGNTTRAPTMVDLHLGAGRRCGPAPPMYEVALGHRVDLAVGTFQRRRDQRAAAQALGVGERGDVDVDRLAPAGRRAGSCAVTITVARFFSCMLVPAGTVTPICCSIASRLCVGEGRGAWSGRRCRRGRRRGRSRPAGCCAPPGWRRLP